MHNFEKQLLVQDTVRHQAENAHHGPICKWKRKACLAVKILPLG